MRENLPAKTDRAQAIEDLTTKALHWHAEFGRNAVETKHAAAHAGWYFMQVQKALAHGSWIPWLEAHNVARTTAHRYIIFAQDIIQWAALQHPTCRSEEQLLGFGIEEALKSPKSWTALMRYTGLLEKQGQYDPDEYAEKKKRGAGQLEFDFDRVFGSVQQLHAIPRSATRPQLETLRDCIRAALDQIEQRLGNLGTDKVLDV